MLLELRIKDLAVIDRLALRLDPGLNVLTGETGAGKSIIVGAVSLLLGERASSDVVRPGSERAIVEGVFRTRPEDGIAELLEEQGIDVEDGLVILRREVAAEGRNRAWVNGAATTARAVGAIGARLVDLHGQSEHEDLVRPERQRALLDAFAGAGADADAVARAWAASREARAELEALDSRRREIEQRAELLRRQAQEIEKAAPRAGEEEELEAEARRLEHAEELARLSRELHESLYADDDSVIARLDRARRALGQLLKIDPEAYDAPAGLDDAYFLIEDLGRRMADYAASLDHDPARLDVIRRRQDLLFRLRSRYGPSLEDVVAAGGAARAELDRLESAGLERRTLERKVEETRRAHDDACKALTKLRAKAATRLSRAVEELLPSLGLPDGRFIVQLRPLDTPGAHGAESVEFDVSLNAGFEPRPIARVASGGELSRLMLALRTTLARTDRTPTLVFDEIDAGIGGRVAHAVATSLREVARTRQVFVISHLAQIAARADHHLLVGKVAKKGTAATEVRELAGDARIRELARLLGGDPESATSQDHARELLATA